jgi:hypothetical protein
MKRKVKKIRRSRLSLDDLGDMYEGELLKMDGFDDCVIGMCIRFGQEPVILYDVEKILAKHMKSGMTRDEAEEFFEFNQIGAWVGDRTPAFCRKLEDF